MPLTPGSCEASGSAQLVLGRCGDGCAHKPQALAFAQLPQAASAAVLAWARIAFPPIVAAPTFKPRAVLPLASLTTSLASSSGQWTASAPGGRLPAWQT